MSETFQENKSKEFDRSDQLRDKLLGEGVTNEELAEFQGLYMFPNNPRGAELKQKQVLGTLTADERIEFNRLKNIEREVDPELARLTAIHEQLGNQEVLVEMNEGKILEVQGEEGTIWTRGLGGCTATLVVMERSNGTRKVILTHYQPSSIADNQNKLSDLMATEESEFVSKKALILTPEQFQEDTETHLWKSVIDEERLAVIRETLQKKLGNDLDVQVIPYSPIAIVNGIDKDFCFIVNVPPHGAISYRTWFTEGEIGL